MIYIVEKFSTSSKRNDSCLINNCGFFTLEFEFCKTTCIKNRYYCRCYNYICEDCSKSIRLLYILYNTSCMNAMQISQWTYNIIIPYAFQNLTSKFEMFSHKLYGSLEIGW